jgi:hypothetical protein
VTRFAGCTITPIDCHRIFVDDDGWEHYRYRVTVRNEGRSTWLIFRTGLGWNRPPTIDEVFESIASDLSYIHSGDYLDSEELGHDLGYDDPAKAEKIWRALVKQYLSFKRVLGEENLTPFIEHYQDH